MYLSEVVIHDQYIALFAAFTLAQVAAFGAWLARLGGRVAAIESRLATAERDQSNLSDRVARLETTQSVHTTQLAVISAGIATIQDDVKDLSRGQDEMLKLLRNKS